MIRFISFIFALSVSSSATALVYYSIQEDGLKNLQYFEPEGLYFGVVGQTESFVLTTEPKGPILSKLRRIGVVVREPAGPSGPGQKVFERLNYELHDFLFFRSEHPSDIHIRLKHYLWPEVIHFIRRSSDLYNLRVSLVFEGEGGKSLEVDLSDSVKWLVLGSGVDDAVTDIEFYRWIKKGGAYCVGLLTNKIVGLFKTAVR